MKQLATLISFIFHPVIFSLIIPFLLVYHSTEDVPYAFKWMIFSALFLCLGLILLLFIRKKEFFSDFDIYRRKDRVSFYGISLVIVISYFLTSVLVKGFFFPLSILSLGIILGIIVFELANQYAKVSIHVGVAVAYVFTISVLYGVRGFIFSWWIAPVVAWSRIYLHKHTPKEATTGAILGIFVTGITFLLGRLLL